MTICKRHNNTAMQNAWSCLLTLLATTTPVWPRWLDMITVPLQPPLLSSDRMGSMNK